MSSETGAARRARRAARRAVRRAARRGASRGRPLPWASAAPPPQSLCCRYRTECLSWAARRGWPTFSCGACQDGEVAELASLAADRDGLLLLAAVVLDPAERCTGEIRHPHRVPSIAAELAKLAGRRAP